MILMRFTNWRAFKALIICLMGLLTSYISVPAAANIPTPQVKPPVPNHSEILDISDAKLFRNALAAADRRSWSEASRLASSIKDNTAKDIILWRRAVVGSATIGELTELVHNHPDWPSMVTIRSKAEKIMFDAPLGARETVDWFRGTDPVSGEGRAALARAHYALGDDISGDKWLKFAWRESRLTRDRQRKLFAEFKSRLTPEDHAARADYLIWQGTRYYSSAEALLTLMPTDDRKLMNARIRLGANRSGITSAINALSEQQLKDTGFLFERAYWRRKQKSKDYALPVYLEMSAPASTEHGRERLWFEKKLLAYWQLETKQYQTAYDLVQNHGFERGADFAEAEFIAGWMALSYLNRPSDALRHFTNLRSGVSFPVSVARGAYWQGRAAEAMGDARADSFYAESARHVNTYYGQLAATRSAGGPTYLGLPPEPDGQALSPAFEANDYVRALRLIGETGNGGVFRQFSYHIDDIVTDPRELSLLGQIAREYQFPAPAVRAAKQSGRFGAMLSETGYPMPDVITKLGPDFDIPFVLAIARQESEFNINAISSAKAYGMMQMIDSTARQTARIHGERYNRSWLTTDQTYAARLGALHLNDLLKSFDGSYIMAAAAYNAGSSRVTRWIKLYGDPRKPGMDPIEWVENIPFSETRNYVQRVLENTQVYRARLDNGAAELRIDHDLKQGQN